MPYKDKFGKFGRLMARGSSGETQEVKLGFSRCVLRYKRVAIFNCPFVTAPNARVPLVVCCCKYYVYDTGTEGEISKIYWIVFNCPFLISRCWGPFPGALGEYSLELLT